MNLTPSSIYGVSLVAVNQYSLTNNRKDFVTFQFHQTASRGNGADCSIMVRISIHRIFTLYACMYIDLCNYTH